jgi:lysophospholipase L1-like esterase
MKEMRATAKSVKKAEKSLKKHSKLCIFLIILPIVVIFTTGILWFIFPAGALNQNAQPEQNQTVDTQSIIAKINQPLKAPEAESQETSRQIAEQKRLEEIAKEAERKRIEEEKFLALKKELEIKKALHDAQHKVCFIGDSISVVAADMAINILNAGQPAENQPYGNINIAWGGATTGDWVGVIDSAINACREEKNVDVVMIMLGTNDAGHSVPTGTYLTHMARIRFVAGSVVGATVIVNCPILLKTSETGMNLTIEYCASLNSTTPIELPLSDNIHPTNDGYNTLASMWASTIKSIVGI